MNTECKIREDGGIVEPDNPNETTQPCENEAENGKTEETEMDNTGGKFKCKFCDKIYSQNAGRYNHMKHVHGFTVMERGAVTCLEPECKYICGSKEKLQKHLMNVHKKEMTIITLEFLSITEFENWKDEFEKREKCRFVKKSGSRMTEDGLKLCYFYCSRSGTFVSHSRGVKKKSIKGTSKISVHCTASITLVEAKTGEVQVKVCATHYGHSVDLKHLRLTRVDKSNIAWQIAQGIPREIVLDNIRASAGSDIDRIHLITIKDIKNIEKAFGIQSNEYKRINTGLTNLDAWVDKMKCHGDKSMILYYKSRKTNSLPDDLLANQDVCLIVMTKGQSDIFKKFGDNGIFYLTVLPIKNEYEMSLYTLMVVDDLNEVLPVAYMISNRLDESVTTFFCDQIQDKVGSFNTKALMTDRVEMLYRAWSTVFGKTTKHVWSNRHVDNDWRELLIMVKDEELQCSIYETLYSFLKIKNPVIFEKEFQELETSLMQNSGTIQFGKVFTSVYSITKELWAGCYVKNDVGINVHLNLDNIYNEIKAVCNSRGKYARLFDKIVQDLLKVVSDRQCYRNNKICKQAEDLGLHHSLALNIKEERVSQLSEVKWRVNSDKDPEKLYFIVEKQTKQCTQIGQLYCNKCNICAHAFKCSCSVYEFDCTMCKHIHAVGLSLVKKRQADEDKVMEENTADCTMEHFVEEVLIETSSLKTDVVALIQSMEKDVETINEDEVLANVLLRLKNSGRIVKNVLPPPKRKRGRPRKSPDLSKFEISSSKTTNVVKKRRGRKRKNPELVVQKEAIVEQVLRRSERPRKRNPYLPNILRR